MNGQESTSSAGDGEPSGHVPGIEATRLIAVRHGETAWNLEARLQGQIDIPLNERGQVQAMRAALDRGDHRQARSLAATLSTSGDPELKGAGEEMAARFRRDPWVDAVFVVTGLLMVFLAVHYLGHRG